MSNRPALKKENEFEDFVETATNLPIEKLSQQALDDLLERKGRELERNNLELSRKVYANYQSFRLIILFFVCSFHSRVFSLFLVSFCFSSCCNPHRCYVVGRILRE